MKRSTPEAPSLERPADVRAFVAGVMRDVEACESDERAWLFRDGLLLELRALTLREARRWEVHPESQYEINMREAYGRISPYRRSAELHAHSVAEFAYRARDIAAEKRETAEREARRSQFELAAHHHRRMTFGEHVREDERARAAQAAARAR